MATFPEIAPQVPYETFDSFRTLEGGPYDNGIVVTNTTRLYPLYRAVLKFNMNSWSSYETLYQFFYDRKGRSGTFTFFDFNGHDNVPIGIQWPKLYVATLDGTTTVFDLPYKSGTSYAIYRNGTLLTLTTDYSISLGAGTDGRDRITMVVAGTSGHILEAKAIGRRAVNARFVVDEISFESFYAMLTKTGLEIQEVRSA